MMVISMTLMPACTARLYITLVLWCTFGKKHKVLKLNLQRTTQAIDNDYQQQNAADCNTTSSLLTSFLHADHPYAYARDVGSNEAVAAYEAALPPAVLAVFLDSVNVPTTGDVQADTERHVAAYAPLAAANAAIQAGYAGRRMLHA